MKKFAICYVLLLIMARLVLNSLPDVEEMPINMHHVSYVLCALVALVMTFLSYKFENTKYN